jgi:hypothetical protein
MLLGFFLAKGVPPLEFKPAYSVGDLLTVWEAGQGRSASARRRAVSIAAWRKTRMRGWRLLDSLAPT